MALTPSSPSPTCGEGKQTPVHTGAAAFSRREAAQRSVPGDRHINLFEPPSHDGVRGRQQAATSLVRIGEDRR
jgi:hypothetical protein